MGGLVRMNKGIVRACPKSVPASFLGCQSKWLGVGDRICEGLESKFNHVRVAYLSVLL